MSKWAAYTNSKAIILSLPYPYSYLADINEQAEDMFFGLVKQMAEREGVTEQLKAENQILWVAWINGTEKPLSTKWNLIKINLFMKSV